MTIINEEHVYLQLYARAPAPCRDYYGLTVTSNFVILNIWNISHGPHVFPKRLKSRLDEFQEDKHLQCEMRRLFGEHVLNFAKELAARGRNLQFLPVRIFLRILRLLAANDILRLSQTSKIFFELCNTEAAWKIIFRKRLKKSVLLRDIKSAESIGWKGTVREKLGLTMHTKKNISSKQTPANNKAKIQIAGTKSQNVPKNVANKLESTKNVKIPNNVHVAPSAQPKKIDANSKTLELNNKLPSVHLGAKKPEINVTKNLGKEIKAKATKSVGQLKAMGNEKADDVKKINVTTKHVPVHQKSPAKLISQTANRTQIGAAKVFSKSPEETGDGLKNNVLKNYLRKKVSCKSAQLPKF